MKIIAIYPGRFQPFGPHHKQAFDWLQNQFGANNTFIVTSNKTEDSRSPLTFAEKQAIMTSSGVSPSQIIQVRNPYRAEELLNQYDPESTAVVFMYGEKDAGRLSYSKKDGTPGYFQKYQGQQTLKPFSQHGYVVIAPHINITIPGLGEMSGTNLRKFIGISTPETFKQVFGWYNPKIYDVLKQKITENFLGNTLQLITEGGAFDNGKQVKCAICGEWMGQIQYRHLHYKHQITVFEYKQLYPTAPLISENNKNTKDSGKNPMSKLENRKKISSKLKGKNIGFGAPGKKNTHSDQTKKIMSSNNCMHNPEIRKKVSAGVKESYVKNPELRKIRGETLGKSVYTEEYKQFMYQTGKWIHPDHKKQFQLYYETVRKLTNKNFYLFFNEIPNAKLRDRQNHLDHKISIVYGYKNNIPASIISHYKNLEILPHSINESKGSSNSITLKQLIIDIKNSNDPLGTRQLLLCGGAFGHMSHPYEDRSFTFTDLEELVDRSLSGTLNVEGDVQEKTDGQNLMVTYKDGKLGAARNKSTIIDPMDISQLASKFAGRGSIETAFVNAMQDLQTALESLGGENLTRIFKNGKRFLNIEIIYPGTKNVIDYGETAYLVLLGMVEFNEAGEPVENLTREAAQLQGLIKKVNADQQNTFSIIAPRALEIAKSADFAEKSTYFKGKINQVALSAGLKTSNTLGEYYRAKFSDIIDYTFNVSLEIKNVLLNRWVNSDKSVRLTKQLLGDQYESVVAYEKNQLADDYKKIQWPIESIILELGVEVMSNIKDYLSVSPDKTIQELRKDLATLIRTAKSSSDPKILKSFKANLTKIQQLGGFNKIMPAEGIVFPFKGRLMKFTGTFAPINQLLGLFRYSR